MRDDSAGKRVASHSGGVLGVVTYVERGLDEDYCVALACSCQPKEHPSAIAARLFRLARPKRG